MGTSRSEGLTCGTPPRLAIIRAISSARRLSNAATCRPPNEEEDEVCSGNSVMQDDQTMLAPVTIRSFQHTLGAGLRGWVRCTGSATSARILGATGLLPVLFWLTLL